MARGVNKVIIIGNVGKAPEMRYTPNGKAVTTFGVAVNEQWGSGDEKQTATEWFNCEAWGKAAETLSKYLKEGSKVCIIGRLRTDKWEKDGVKHSRVKVIVGEFTFLGGGSDTEEVDDAEEGFEFG